MEIADRRRTKRKHWQTKRIIRRKRCKTIVQCTSKPRPRRATTSSSGDLESYNVLDLDSETTPKDQGVDMATTIQRSKSCRTKRKHKRTKRKHKQKRKHKRKHKRVNRRKRRKLLAKRPTTILTL